MFYTLHIACVASTEYAGHKTTTAKGTTCKSWSSVTAAMKYSDNQFIDGSKSAASNYCRDPGGDGYIWCYTNAIMGNWEFCDVSVCDYINSGAVKNNMREYLKQIFYSITPLQLLL